MRAAVFFERDGILNLARAEGAQQRHPLNLDEFIINEDAIAPLQAARDAGFLLIAITNEPGLSRGTQSRRELDLMHARLRATFPLTDILVCPHEEMDSCPCRKPKPGLIYEAAFKYKLRLEHCFVVSDKWQDAKAAHVAGCTSVLVRSRWNGSDHYDYLVPDIESAISKTLQLQHAPMLNRTRLIPQPA